MTRDLALKLLGALLIAALAAALVFGIVHAYEAWRAHVYEQGDAAGAARVQKLWDDDRLKWAAETMTQVADARDDEQRMAAQAAQGEKDAIDRAQARAAQQADAARRSAAAAGGLFSQLAALDENARALGIPDAAACPGLFAQQRDAAIRARALFGACAAEYRSLAADADTAVAGIELRLDTALTWIRSTGAPGAADLSP